jgi:hypothetical protein
MKIGILWYKVQTKEGAKYNIIFNFFIALKQAKNPFVFFKKKKNPFVVVDLFCVVIFLIHK